MHAVTLLTNLQIFICESHKNVFGSWAVPGPTGGAIALPQTPSRYKGERKEMVGNRDAEEGKGGIGRGGSLRKGERA